MATATRQRLRCGKCQRVFDWSGRGRRPTYCSTPCRTRAARARSLAEAKGSHTATVTRLKGPRDRAKPADQVPDDTVDPDGPLYLATLADLDEAGRATTSDGLAALFLARSIDESGGETGSGKKALVSEWRVQKELALRVEGDEAGDEVDDIKARRAARGGRA